MSDGREHRRRRLSRRDLLRLGLVGGGGLVIGAAGGFAVGRSNASAPGSSQQPGAAGGTPAPLGPAAFPIGIGDDGRGFVDGDGAPYFYLADTAWTAMCRMTRESFETLATARRDSGFTALQMSVLDFDPEAENAGGHHPFTSTGALDSPALADDGEDYWSMVDWCIDTCADLGLVAALVPSWYGGWGDAWRGHLTQANAAAYGTFLAERYGDRPNVWWLLGGDNSPDVDDNSTSGVPPGLDRGPRIAETIAMGRALQAGAGVPQLMSYHTERNKTPEQYFGTEEWYTISAAYSGQHPIEYVATEYERETVRPVVLWEAYYDERPTDPILDRPQLRAQAYHTLFSGAAGFAYGHSQVWPIDDGWAEALTAESARDMTVLSSLLARYGTAPLTPVSGGTAGLLPDGYGEPDSDSAVSAALIADDGGALVYFGESRSTVRLDTTALDASASYTIEWMNTASGEEFFVADDRSGADVEVAWPSSWPDAVLVIRR